jgi:hypothetical protein
MLDADHELFLSYHRPDSRELVRQVEDSLRTRGVPVWSDVELMPGQDWRKAITAAIRSAGGFVVFLSPGYSDSPYSLMELGAALGSDAPVIPVQLEDAPLPADLWQIQTINGRGMSPDQIAEAIKQVLDHPPVAA